MGIFSKRKDNKDKKKEVNRLSNIDDSKKHEDKKSMKGLYSEGKVTGVKKGKDLKVETTASGSEKSVKKTRKYYNAYKILAKPLVTEKASSVGVENKYIFQVAPKANKIEIAKAIQEVYGVKPVNVNIIKVRGKKTRYGRVQGKRKDWKKAIIKLPVGKSIKIYEGV